PTLAAGQPEAIVWSDNFDSYATGSQLHGQGGWKGWFNDPAGGALTSAAQARSAPNSAAILGASDLVHEYAGATSGQWLYTAWQYVPTDFTGESYFIILNSYDDAGSSLNWSVQVKVNGTSNLVENDGGVSGGSLALVRGQWVELRVEIDLDADTGDFYYNNQLLYSGTWSGQVSGGGAVNIAAVDLYANGASVIYYDDMSLAQPGPDIDVDPLALASTQAPDTVVALALTITNNGDAQLAWSIAEDPATSCSAPADVPWLSVNPLGAQGQAPGASVPVTVSLDSTGLAPGVYSANLCVASDDPDPGPGNGTDLVVVSVALTVEDTGPGPSVLEIPTLGAAGAALLGLALAGLGIGALRRRRG
ncbi:MAG TPA: hypothetical protein VLA75_10400, partial [Thermoanaerobaculia bacterium]|nr:hypothetical protein [Thermoanaerobaculia bacterium]